jgi:hypothetical protein
MFTRPNGDYLECCDDDGEPFALISDGSIEYMTDRPTARQKDFANQHRHTY